MADITEITNFNTFGDILDNYREGDDVLPLSKNFFADFYDKFDSVANLSPLFKNSDLDEYRTSSSREEIKRESSFLGALFKSTLEHLDTDGRTQMLQQFFDVVGFMYREDSNHPVHRDYLKVLACSLGGISKSEVKKALNGMSLSARCTARCLEKCYEGPDTAFLKSVDLSLGNEPLRLDEKALDSSAVALIEKYANTLTLDEMTSLMKASNGNYGEGVIAAYIERASVYCQQQETAAQEVLSVLEGARRVEFKEGDARVGKNLLTLAYSDKEIGLELLSAAMFHSFEPFEANEEIKKDALVVEAAKMVGARKAFNNFIKPNSNPYYYYSDDMVRYNPDKIDDILERLGDRWTEGAQVAKSLENLMKDSQLDNTIRIKIASKMMEHKDYAQKWSFVGEVLDVVNGMQRPQGTAFVKLEKQLNEAVVVYAQEVKEAQQQDSIEKEKENARQTNRLRFFEAQGASAGAQKAVNLIGDLRRGRDKIVECGGKMLSQKDAEQMVKASLNGEQVVLAPVKERLFDKLSSSRRHRVGDLNNAIASFNELLKCVQSLPADEKAAKRKYRKAVMSADGGTEPEQALRSEFESAKAKELLNCFQGKIFEVSTEKEVQGFLQEQIQVRDGYEEKMETSTGVRKNRRTEALKKYGLLAKMKELVTKQKAHKKADRKASRVDGKEDKLALRQKGLKGAKSMAQRTAVMRRTGLTNC